MTCAALCATSESSWHGLEGKAGRPIGELVENLPDLAVLVEPMLIVRRTFANRSSSCIAVCWPLSG